MKEMDVENVQGVKCEMRKKYEGPLLALPAVLLIASIMIVPLFYTVYCSFSNIDYMMFSGFAGLDNFKKIITNPGIYRSLSITLVITLSSVIISMVLGTLLAVWADGQRPVFAYIIELVGLVPWVTSMVVAALLWKWIMDGDMGLMNYVLNLFGIRSVHLLSKENTALLATVFVIAWRTVGYSMVMILSGLKGVPDNLIEAAAVDGAGQWSIFWKIKVPLIKTPILISSIVLTMSNFNNVTIPMVFTGGGPGEATNVISLELYKMGFHYYQFGPASALSILIFLLNIIFVVIYVKAVKYEL